MNIKIEKNIICGFDNQTCYIKWKGPHQLQSRDSLAEEMKENMTGR